MLLNITKQQTSAVKLSATANDRHLILDVKEGINKVTKKPYLFTGVLMADGKFTTIKGRHDKGVCSSTFKPCKGRYILGKVKAEVVMLDKENLGKDNLMLYVRENGQTVWSSNNLGDLAIVVINKQKDNQTGEYKEYGTVFESELFTGEIAPFNIDKARENNEKIKEKKRIENIKNGVAYINKGPSEETKSVIQIFIEKNDKIKKDGAILKSKLERKAKLADDKLAATKNTKEV